MGKGKGPIHMHGMFPEHIRIPPMYAVPFGHLAVNLDVVVVLVE